MRRAYFKITNAPKPDPKSLPPKKVVRQNGTDRGSKTKEMLQAEARIAKQEASKRRDDEKNVMQRRSARGQPKLGLQMGVLLDKIKRREEGKQ